MKYKVPIKRLGKSIKILFVIFSLLFAAALLTFFITNKNAKSLDCVGESSILSKDEIISVQDTKNPKTAEGVVNKIKTHKSYTEEPNCLYLVLNYYINISDTKNAEQTFSQLQKIYKPNTVFSSEIGESIKTMEIFKSNIEFLKRQDEMLMKNSIQGPVVN